MDIGKFLAAEKTGWMGGEQLHHGIVLSTRVRLARNLRGVRFPTTFDGEEALGVSESVSRVLLADTEATPPFARFKIGELTALERQVLVEKHLISPTLAQNVESGAVLLAEDETISIMLNEEDHIRIQCLLAGNRLADAYERAGAIDDLLDAHLSYAFDEEFGYLTACPTNSGTGLRASLMMHLPALTMTNSMHPLVAAISRLGMVVRGIYGEGSEALGNVYQISNQVTLGKSERDILSDLQTVASQIIEKEQEARAALQRHSAKRLADRLYRSYGLLAYARLLTTAEAGRCLSDVRLGIDLGIIDEADPVLLSECMVFMQPGFLQQYAGKPLEERDRDELRADMIRERMAACNPSSERPEIAGDTIQINEKGAESHDV